MDGGREVGKVSEEQRGRVIGRHIQQHILTLTDNNSLYNEMWKCNAYETHTNTCTQLKNWWGRFTYISVLLGIPRDRE